MIHLVSGQPVILVVRQLALLLAGSPGLMLLRMHGPFPYILLYVALYGAFGAASPFWPKYFETRSLTSEQIALLLGAGMLVRLAAGPAVGLSPIVCNPYA
jgi:hypothetical protein